MNILELAGIFWWRLRRIYFWCLKLVDCVAALFRFAIHYEASALLRVPSQPAHNLIYISFLTI
jgi:hypothetical protein